MEVELCESCGERGWRYKCPGCETKTCSVECVKRHKAEYGCQGKRSKTKYVSLSSYTTAQLLSDYYFLEEAGRVIDSAHRGWVALRQKETRQKRQTLQRVQSVARKKGISLHLQPPGMARHAMNTSCTVWNRDRRQWSIEWRVQLVFPEAGQQYTEERVSEDLTLGDLLKRYIHSTESDPIIRHRLKRYVERDVSVFLKVKRTSLAATGYCQLQLQSSLTDCLRDKTIVEFPELCVVLSASAGHTITQQVTTHQEVKTVSSLTRLAENYASEEEET